jgi:glyoxylase-like metal-dependent hydrolase (beta-lactamase superfamily II)
VAQVKLRVVHAGNFKLDGGAMFGVVPKSLWQKANPADDQNLCTWAMRCLLVEEGDRRVLIDTGMGDKQDPRFFSYYHPDRPDSLERNLTAAGYQFEDVTDVLLTHLHFDHCGGALYRTETGEIRPRFPKATYWSNRAHWKWATAPNPREKASFLPENILPLEDSGVLRFVDETDAPALFPNFSVEIVNGHTEAMMIPKIRIGARTLLFCADLIPSAAHITLPWIMAYDVRPLVTLNEKREVLDKAAAENWVLFFEHDRAIECCTVQETERGVRVKETFALSEAGLTD